MVADRGFGDTNLYTFLEEFGFNYIIRFRSNIFVADGKGIQKKAKDWLGQKGKMYLFRDARVTTKEIRVPTVLLVQDPDMADPWCIVARDSSLTGAKIKEIYGKRFQIEESFRDLKDDRFGLGLKEVQVKRPERRDCLILLAVLAVELMRMLGEVGEEIGMDREMKTNTSKKRQYSLIRQGRMWFDLLPTMPERKLTPFMTRFGEKIMQEGIFKYLLELK